VRAWPLFDWEAGTLKENFKRFYLSYILWEMTKSRELLLAGLDMDMDSRLLKVARAFLR